MPGVPAAGLSPRSGGDESGDHGDAVGDAPPRVPSPRTAGGLHKFLPPRKSCICGFNKLWTLWPGFIGDLGNTENFCFQTSAERWCLKSDFPHSSSFSPRFLHPLQSQMQAGVLGVCSSLLPWRCPVLFWLSDTSRCPPAQGVSRTTNYNLALYRNPAFNYN